MSQFISSGRIWNETTICQHLMSINIYKYNFIHPKSNRWKPCGWELRRYMGRTAKSTVVVASWQLMREGNLAGASSGVSGFNPIGKIEEEPMIVNRRTFTIKPGLLQDAVQLCEDVINSMEVPASGSRPKILTAFFGPFDVMVMETEHADLGQYQKYWDEVFAHPAFEAFWPKWFALIEAGGTNEIWEVMSPKE